VYAAALESAIGGGNQIYSPASLVDDSPTTFRFADQAYAPDDFKHEFNGTITFRKALAISANVAAVKVGQMAGLNGVIALARRAGITDGLAPTPALALGAYGITPLEIAGAYTAFANDGTYVRPDLISSIDTQGGDELYRTTPDFSHALDPRVNYLVLTMLQDVIAHGTAAGIRSRGFTLPAAGKTGTARDGWFAGFTSQLLCVVWIGFDDYADLNMEGAHSALPIWTEFMQEAARYSPYREAKAFAQPAGVVKVSVDPTTGMLAGPYCPWTVTDWYVDGTQPRETCDQHTGADMQAAEAQTNPDGTPLPITVDARGDGPRPPAIGSGEADRGAAHDFSTEPAAP
jgi:penicillin-binding protein 1B